MTSRHTVDSITSDALDALYEQLDAAEAGEAQRQLATAREALASATTRAARAEAAVARVRAVAGWAIQGWSDLSPEKVLLAVEGHQPPPAPAATQATGQVKTSPPFPYPREVAEDEAPMREYLRADQHQPKEQPAPEPCHGRACAGTGCSHEQAANELTDGDYVLTFDHPPTPAERQQIADHIEQQQPKEPS